MRKWLLLLMSLLAILLGACESNKELNGNSTFKDGSNLENLSGQKKDTKNSFYDVSHFKKYQLLNVVDGDTIRIRYNGSEELVRLLLIDTPETNHPTLGEQPYGQDAKQYTKKLLAGQKTVYLEFDKTDRDKYNRLLAYVYTEKGVSIQEELLKKGLARVAYVYEPNTKHVGWFKSIQRTAQENSIGVWSVKGYVTNRGYNKDVFVGSKTKKVENKKVTTIDSKCVIKGNINSKGKKIYHSPGQENYDATKAEKMFCSAKEAENAGFIAAER